MVNNGRCLPSDICIVVGFNWLAAQFFEGFTDIPNPVLLFYRCVGCFYGRLCYEHTKHLEVQMYFSPLRNLLFRYEHCFPGILYILSG